MRPYQRKRQGLTN